LTVQLKWGVSEKLRLPVAQLIYDAFSVKLRYTLGPRHKGVHFIARSLKSEFGLVALQKGEFVGVAGAKTEDGELVDVNWGLWLRTYHIQAIRTFFIGVPFWYERKHPGMFRLTNLAIVDSARGEGIGTQIVEEFIRIGFEKGYRALKLEVINSNVRAKALYQRLGFEITRYSKIHFPWSHLWGFTGVYEMTYSLK
jgi:ribosomal protein S18 acetylase RimI-like enzyme